MQRRNPRLYTLQGVRVPLPPCAEYPWGEVTVGEIKDAMLTVSKSAQPTLTARDVETQRALDLYEREHGTVFEPVLVPASVARERDREERRRVVLDGAPSAVDRALDAASRALSSFIHRFGGRGGDAGSNADDDSFAEEEEEEDYGRGDGSDVGEEEEDENDDDDDKDDDDPVVEGRLMFTDEAMAAASPPPASSRRRRRRPGRPPAASSPCPVSDLAWHPQLQTWAVGLANDQVRFFDLAAGVWKPHALVHEFQRDIVAVRFSPVGGSPLAVVCRRGVCLWRSVAARGGPSSRFSVWAAWLRHDDQPSVRSAEFSPCGRYLVTLPGRGGGSRMVVWEVCKGAEGATSLYVPGGGARLARWSPTGRHLLTASGSSPGFLVWDTRTWSSRPWDTPRPLRDACWSPTGELLVYATRGSGVVNLLNFQRGAANLRGRVCINVGRDAAPPDTGGAVRSMAWSPTGERLAVSFAGRGPGSELVAVFGAQPGLSPSFHPIGFVRGPPADASGSPNRPVRIAFRPHFDRGALLTVAYAAGHICCIPMYFSHGDE